MVLVVCWFVVEIEFFLILRVVIDIDCYVLCNLCVDFMYLNLNV